MEYKIGDRIAYRARFLRSISDYSYESAQRRGTVTSISDWPLIEIQWDGEKDTHHVGEYNILLANRIHLEPA